MNSVRKSKQINFQKTTITISNLLFTQYINLVAPLKTRFIPCIFLLISLVGCKQQIAKKANEKGKTATMARLKSYWHDERIDYFGTATAMGQDAAINVFGYQFSRDEGLVFTTQQPETIELALYWSEERQDNATLASQRSIKEILSSGAGYEKKAIEGYIYSNQKKGTVPLKLFYNKGLFDYYTTSSEKGQKMAKDTGYEFVRVEGYVMP